MTAPRRLLTIRAALERAVIGDLVRSPLLRPKQMRYPSIAWAALAVSLSVHSYT